MTNPTKKIVLLLATTLAACAHGPARSVPQSPTSSATPPADTRTAAFRTPARPAAVPRSEPGNAAIYFDLDSYTLRDDARPLLQRMAATEKTTSAVLRVEGNCDDRGTVEYNLALGEQRARAASQYLQALGVPKDRITVVSYGSQRPAVQGEDESAWSRNRRDDLVIH